MPLNKETETFKVLRVGIGWVSFKIKMFVVFVFRVFLNW